MKNNKLDNLVSWLVYPDNFPKFKGKAYKIHDDMIEKHKDYIFEALKSCAKEYQGSLKEINDEDLGNDFQDSVEEYEKTKNIQVLKDHICEAIRMSDLVELNEYLIGVPTNIINSILEDVNEHVQKIVYESGFKTFSNKKENFWVETISEVKKRIEEEDIWCSEMCEIG